VSKKASEAQEKTWEERTQREEKVIWKEKGALPSGRKTREGREARVGKERTELSNKLSEADPLFNLISNSAKQAWSRGESSRSTEKEIKNEGGEPALQVQPQKKSRLHRQKEGQGDVRRESLLQRGGEADFINLANRGREISTGKDFVKKWERARKTGSVPLPLEGGGGRGQLVDRTRSGKKIKTTHEQEGGEKRNTPYLLAKRERGDWSYRNTGNEKNKET